MAAARHRYQSFFYILITAALAGGLVIDRHYFRGAAGRSGELGLLPWRSEAGEGRTLQNILSVSALNERLAAEGYRLKSPRQLAQLEPLSVRGWIERTSQQE